MWAWEVQQETGEEAHRNRSGLMQGYLRRWSQPGGGVGKPVPPQAQQSRAKWTRPPDRSRGLREKDAGCEPGVPRAALLPTSSGFPMVGTPKTAARGQGAPGVHADRVGRPPTLTTG